MDSIRGARFNPRLAEGITADVIGSLSSLRDLRVIAGASTQRVDRTKTPVEIGAELGVASVLDASIRRSANSVRIVAQLVDAKTGAQLWSDSFDNSPAEIVNLKSDVASQIALALRGELSTQDRLLLRPSKVSNARAFDLYLRGRHLVALRTEARVTEGLKSFQDALIVDPSFAAAYAGISDAYTTLGVFGSLPRSEAFARSADAARHAIALDDTLAEAHTSLAYALKNQFDWNGSEKSFKRAIELKPGSAQAHQWYSVLLTQQGRLPEAVAEAKLAVSLDPLSVGPTLQFASVLTQQRRYPDALVQYDRSLQLNLHFATTYRHKALALAHAGRFAEALEALNKAFAETPAGAEDLELKADRGYISAAAGERGVAEQIARELAARHRMTGEHVSGGIAAIYAGLGRLDEAMSWLSRAESERDPEVGYLRVDARWDRLRDDPRFKRIVSDVFPN
jgi:adenylate cyclase